ncbi:GNAT family N-acetyltransferase [candidate division TA06 bacterium]|nr:GNAT family N-acetyltransferase [candidate division TA06 bacterium]
MTKNSDLIFVLKNPFPSYQLKYPGHTVRPALEEAVENDFYQVLFDSYGPPRMTREAFELDLKEGWYTRADCLIMYDGERPVAAGQIRTEAQNGRVIGFLDTLGVPKASQGKGLGRDMTIRRVRMLAERGAEEIRTEVAEDNWPMMNILMGLEFVPEEVKPSQ